MSRGWAVLRRELEERWRVLPTAFLLGLLPLVLRWLPMGHGLDPEDLREATTLALSSLFTLGVAVVLGAAMVARELGEKRLGFYYARPIPSASLWWGKLSAALGLAVACWFLVWLPSWVGGAEPGRHLQEIERWLHYFDSNRVWLAGMGGDSVDSWWASARDEPSSWRPWWLGALLVASIVLASHFVATSLRSRSPWLLLDFVAAGVLTFGLGIAVQQLTTMAADPGLGQGVLGASVVFPLAALVAGFAQARWGRTVATRSHIVFSATLWTLLSLAVALYAAWVWRSSVTGPGALDEVIHFRLADRGALAVVSGETDDGTGYQPTFVVGPEGELHTLPAAPRLEEWPRVSPEGRWLTGSRCGLAPRAGCELWSRDFANEGREQVVATSQRGVVTALGPEGRFGVLEEDRLALYDLSSNRLLSTYRVSVASDHRWLRLDDRGEPWLAFSWLSARDSTFEIWNLGPAGKLQPHLSVKSYAASLSPDWDRVGLFAQEGFQAWDVAEAKPLATLSVDVLRIRRVRFLSAGRMAVRESGSHDKPPRVLVTDRNGGELSTFERDGATRWLLGGELEPGKLLLGIGTIQDKGEDDSRFLPTSWHRWETLLVDVESGAILRTFPERYPSAHGHPLGEPYPQVLMTADEQPEILRPGAEQPIPVDYRALGSTTGALP